MSFQLTLSMTGVSNLKKREITGEDNHTIASIWSLVYDSAEILIKSLTCIIEHKNHKIMYFEEKKKSY